MAYEYSYYCPVYVELLENILEQDKKNVPAYNFIIRPLIKSCLYSYVYGLSDDNELYIQNKEILIYEKGKHKFDLTKECVIGHEDLWCASQRKRGSIIIILEYNLEIFENIFKYVYNVANLGTPNSGNTPSAVKKCKEEMKNGRIGICLPGLNNSILSSGIDCMQIYIRQDNKNDLFKIADENCNIIDREKQALERLKKMFMEKGF